MKPSVLLHFVKCLYCPFLKGCVVKLLLYGQLEIFDLQKNISINGSFGICHLHQNNTIGLYVISIFHNFSSCSPKNASGGKKLAAKQTFCQRSGAYHFSMVIWLHTFFQRSSQSWNLQPSKKSVIASSNVCLGCTHLPDPFSKGLWECQVWTGKGQMPCCQHSIMMSASSSKRASKPSFLQRKAFPPGLVFLVGAPDSLG